jgi:hypothetical protein
MWHYTPLYAPIKDLEKAVKNKFCWAWLEDENMSKIGRKTMKCRIGDCIRKIDVPGRIVCTWCNDVINYEKGGKKVGCFRFCSLAG